MAVRNQVDQRNNDSRASRARNSAPPPAVRDVLVILKGLPHRRRTSASRVTGNDHRRLLSALLQVMLDPVTEVPLFFACFRGFASALRNGHRLEREGEISGPILAATENKAAVHPKAESAIAIIKSAGRSVGRLRESEVAHELGIDPAHLGRVLKNQTGLGFHEWQTAVRLQLAVQWLAKENTQIKVVAEEAGFMGTAQLDRLFAATIGMTPGAFRTLAQEIADAVLSA